MGSFWCLRFLTQHLSFEGIGVAIEIWVGLRQLILSNAVKEARQLQRPQPPSFPAHFLYEYVKNICRFM